MPSTDPTLALTRDFEQYSRVNVLWSDEMQRKRAIAIAAEQQARQSRLLLAAALLLLPALLLLLISP